MWIQLLVFLLILAAVLAFFLQTRKIRTAYIWISITILSLLVWLVLIVVPPGRILPFNINNWYQIGNFSTVLTFSFNEVNWPLIFSLAAFNLAFFLSAVVRLDIRSDLRFWIIQLILTGLAMLAVLAGNLWTLLIMWTALDVTAFFYYYQVSKSAYTIQIFRVMIIKSIGSIFLVWFIAQSVQGGINPSLRDLPSSASLALFAAAFLHSGVLPISAKREKIQTESDRIIQVAYKTINFVVSFSLVPYLVQPGFSGLPLIITKIIALGVVLFSARLWAQSAAADTHENIFLFCLSGFFFIHFLSGLHSASAHLLLFALFSILWMTIYTHRAKTLFIFYGIFLFLISGLPFSIFSLGTRGLLVQGVGVEQIFLLAAFVLLLTGCGRRILIDQKDFHDLEPWFQAVYLSALFVFSFSQIIVVINQFTSLQDEMRMSWLGLGSSLASVILYLLIRHRRQPVRTAGVNLLEVTHGGIAIFSMNWLFRITAFLRDKVGRLITAFSLLLEGEGGVLWALVFLILMISLINPG